MMTNIIRNTHITIVCVLIAFALISLSVNYNLPSHEIVKQSTVAVETFYKGRKVGIGTGIIIDNDKGYVLTNFHVIQKALMPHVIKNVEILVSGPKNRKKFTVVDTINFPITDMSILKVDKWKKFTSLNNSRQAIFGNHDDIQQGDRVYTLGHPSRQKYVLSDGIVSRRLIDYKSPLQHYIMSTANIHAGNSGGPLFKSDGKIYGMNTLAGTSTERGLYGMAINSSHIKRYLSDAFEYKELRVPALGVSVINSFNSNNLIVNRVVPNPNYLGYRQKVKKGWTVKSIKTNYRDVEIPLKDRLTFYYELIMVKYDETFQIRFGTENGDKVITFHSNVNVNDIEKKDAKKPESK